MNLVLDNIVFSLQRAGGISVYWKELIERMQRDDLSFRAVEHPQAADNIFRQQIQIAPERLIPDRRLPLKLLRYLPIPPVGNDETLYHSSYYRLPQRRDGCRIITVYDFAYEHFRSGPARRVHTAQKRAAARAADGIICISESTRRDLLTFFPEIPERNVTAIPLAASPSYVPLPADAVPPPGLPEKPFVLFVGARDFYKNFTFAVQAVAQLPDYALVSVGGGALSGEEEVLLNKRLPGRHVHVASADNDLLNRFYNCAYAFLYPSSYEGFGIPVLEAMAAGCPVVAVNTSSVPEVAGEAGLLVEEAVPEAFAEQILRLENDGFRADIIRRGIQQASRFSWETCYRQTLDFYKKVRG